MQELWTKVDRFFEKDLLKVDPALEAAVASCEKLGIPPIQVSPLLGQLLYICAKMTPARRILEIGTLAGYSGICLGRALDENGKLLSLEVEPKHADAARANWKTAGLEQKNEVRVGRALDILPGLTSEWAPFDFVFIDADKQNNPNYFEWAIRLTKAGSLILVDNVVREGKVADTSDNSPAVDGVRRLNALIKNSHQVEATAIQCVGVKGHDGFVLARRK